MERAKEYVKKELEAIDDKPKYYVSLLVESLVAIGVGGLVAYFLAPEFMYELMASAAGLFLIVEHYVKWDSLDFLTDPLGHETFGGVLLISAAYSIYRKLKRN